MSKHYCRSLKRAHLKKMNNFRIMASRFGSGSDYRFTLIFGSKNYCKNAQSKKFVVIL